MGDKTSEVTAADLRRVALALERANGKTWRQAIVVVFVGFVATAVVWTFNRWTEDRIGAVQAPIDAKQNERAAKIEAALSVEQSEREREAARLQQNDVDFVDYLQESDRYDRAVLDGVATKLRVRKPDRAQLERAAKRLGAIKERGRAR
jgi:hypothetical protein